MQGVTRHEGAADTVGLLNGPGFGVGHGFGFKSCPGNAETTPGGCCGLVIGAADSSCGTGVSSPVRRGRGARRSGIALHEKHRNFWDYLCNQAEKG